MTLGTTPYGPRAKTVRALVDGGPEVMAGVARWSIDPAAADRLWDHALPEVS